MFSRRMRPGVTRIDVEIAIERLRRDGRRPTIRAVRGALRTGSFSTIRRHMVEVEKVAEKPAAEPGHDEQAAFSISHADSSQKEVGLLEAKISRLQDDLDKAEDLAATLQTRLVGLQSQLAAFEGHQNLPGTEAITPAQAASVLLSSLDQPALEAFARFLLSQPQK